MASPVLQFKRGSSTNVGLASFKAGEPGFTTDKYDFYIGLDATAANQKFFGSARYWTRETGSAAALLKLVDKNGSNSINLKSPDTLSGITTYTFPATPTAGNFLQVAADGTLSWASVTASATFSNATINNSSISTSVIYSSTIASTGIAFSGSTSGVTTVQASAVASGVLTLPATTDTLVGKATTDTFTNKTFDTAGTGNVLKINGNQISAYTGTGNTIVLSNSPALVTPNIGVASGTSLNVTGVITASSFSGNATSATYATSAGIATYANTAGIATYASTAGIATYATSAGIATYATTAGIATYATSSGVSTSVIGGIASVTQLSVSGVSTFSGAISGTQASFSGIVTGSQLVSTVATGTAPLTVSSTTLVNNLNVQYLSGLTSSYFTNAANLTGTAPASVISQSSGLNVSGNLNVTGNITIGGTTAFLNAQQLQIADRDIVLGFTTDVNGNDISSDTTANHGGVAVASTVGSPIVNIPLQSGINSNPTTYKQFMWVKQGNYAGWGTDSWITNYPISIGTTVIQNSSRFTVGAGFTVYDTYLDATDIKARNINAVGVITASSFSGNATSATYATTAGIATYATSAGIATYATSSGVSTSVIGGIASVTQLSVSGVSTFSGIATHTASLFGTQASFTGVVTASSFVGSFTGTITGTASTATRAITVDTTSTSTNTDYYVPFVSNITGTNGETIRVGTGLSLNPSTGNVGVASILSVGSVSATNSYIKAGGGSNAMFLYSNGDVSFQAKVIANNFRSSSNASNTLTFVDLDASFARNLSIAGVATVTGNLSVNGTDVTTTSSSLNVFNTTASTINAFGNASALVVGASSGIATINNPTVTLPNATTVNVNGANPSFVSSSTGVLTLFNTNLTSVNAFGAATNILLGAATGVTTVRNSLRVTSSLYDSTNNAGTSGQFLTVTGSGIGWTTISGVSAGTISTATRANTVDTTSAGLLNQNYYIPFVSNNTGTNGETVRVGAAFSVNPSTNTLTVANAQLSSIKALDGTTSITLTNGTGAVSMASDLTVGGNLYVNGNTTQVNTSELQVYDRTITLGIQSGTTASTTTWDLGILMNYGDAGVAKTSGVIWESSNKRFQFAASSDNLSGINTNTPQISVSTFAPIEVAELWINNTCTGGASQVIACSGSTLVLQNITIDAGAF